MAVTVLTMTTPAKDINPEFDEYLLAAQEYNPYVPSRMNMLWMVFPPSIVFLSSTIRRRCYNGMQFLLNRTPMTWMLKAGTYKENDKK